MQTKNMHQGERAHAIVIGGSIAGLLAARVLLNHFERVTIIERDRYPQEPIFRPGTPQARHLHTTLVKGQQILEALFPQLKAKLLAQGALERDYGNDCLYYYGNRCPSVPPVIRGWNCSRILLEWQIRQELMKYDQLCIIEGHEVSGLLFNQDTHTVIGVQFHQRDHNAHNDVQELKADLVVDASGSSSHILQWLKELGYKAPKETIVDTHIGYATQLYESPAYYDYTGIVIQATQQNHRGGSLMTIEKGRWIIALGGIRGDYPPTNQTGFMEFAQSLPDSTLYEAATLGTPTSPIYGYRRTENRLRHFERIRKLEGLIVVGDALCTFNPVYGQGMTVAALEAQALDACLHKIKGQGLTQAFQKQALRVLRGPWLSTTAADKQKKGLASWYRNRLIALVSHDQAAFLVLLEVAHMLRHPVALLHPRIFIKVIAKGHRQIM